MAKIILVTGGCRSGKSDIALEMAEKLSSSRLFVATCPVIDNEMTERIARHTAERQGRGWVTIEEETNIAAVLESSRNKYDVILIDCITLWVNNIMFNRSAESMDCGLADDVVALCQDWLDRAKEIDATLFCVTNELGLGIVPENKLARIYRDIVGSCNQMIAAAASDVHLVSCGIPLQLKGN